MLNYLGRRGWAAGLAAAMALCPSWDPDASAASLEQPLNDLLFNQRLTASLRCLISRWGGWDGGGRHTTHPARGWQHCLTPGPVQAQGGDWREGGCGACAAGRTRPPPRPCGPSPP